MKFLDLIKAITARWYVLTVGMIIGGLFAWGGTFFMPPIYESDAVFYVSIDYTQTGMLTDVEEDQIMRGIGDMIFSDETTLATINKLEGEGVRISKDEFYDDAIFEREEFRWAIRYRDPNPVLAYQVVGAWANQAGYPYPKFTGSCTHSRFLCRSINRPGILPAANDTNRCFR